MPNSFPRADAHPVTNAERLPYVRHARDCEYVVSDGPAPCTCDFYDREQAAIAALTKAEAR